MPVHCDKFCYLKFYPKTCYLNKILFMEDSIMKIKNLHVNLKVVINCLECLKSIENIFY